MRESGIDTPSEEEPALPRWAKLGPRLAFPGVGPPPSQRRGLGIAEPIPLPLKEEFQVDGRSAVGCLVAFRPRV